MKNLYINVDLISVKEVKKSFRTRLRGGVKKFWKQGRGNIFSTGEIKDFRVEGCFGLSRGDFCLGGESQHPSTSHCFVIFIGNLIL